jgi:hypothetical protein
MLSIQVSKKEKDFVTMSNGMVKDVSKYSSVFKDDSSFKTVETMLLNIKEYLIQVSKEALKEELGKGFDPKYRTFVDGKPDNNLNDVKPLGKIQFMARQDIVDAVMGIYRNIVKMSKVLKGDYIKANMVFFNSILIADNDLELKTNITAIANNRTFRKDDTIRFVNIAAYARRLETLGVVAGNMRQLGMKSDISKWKRQGKKAKWRSPPNGVYKRVADMAKRQYRVAGAIKFDLLLGNNLGIGNLSLARGFKRNTRVKGGRAYLYPTIVLKLDSVGYTQ